MAFDRSTQLFEENTCSATAEAPRSPFFRAWQCSQIKAMVQGPTCLANVGVGGIQHTGCCTLLLSCGLLVLGPWGAQGPASGS